MRNARKKQLVQSRDTAIYATYRLKVKKNLRTDFIIEQLSLQYFISERWVWKIIREQTKLADEAKQTNLFQSQP